MHVFEGIFPVTERDLGEALLQAPAVDVGEWHAQDIMGRPELVSHELQNVIIKFELPVKQVVLADLVEPNLPWAEEHFRERVSGEPLNPPPSAAAWGAVQDKTAVDKHRHDFGGPAPQYSHTYPERFWPKIAGEGCLECARPTPNMGIRFWWGDLGDVVRMLIHKPLTRQAYLPVFFPEDTGAIHGHRIPCTLGYHFMIRERQLHTTYLIRSCDFVRHFRDDVYLAGRLAQWIADHCSLKVGWLTMHTMSMHIFAGDLPRMRRAYECDLPVEDTSEPLDWTYHP